MRRSVGLMLFVVGAGALGVAWRARRSRVGRPPVVAAHPLPPPVVGHRRTPLARAIPGAMVRIPGGTFLMGTNDGYFTEELPVHRVAVADFDLDLTEVTVAAYAACVRRGACEPAPTTADWPDIFPPERPLANSFCNGNRADRQEHPVNCLTWTQADTYCRAVGRRLPTEEEWEYAARGGDEQRTYAWGNDPPTVLRMNACGVECAEAMRRIRPWTFLYPESDGWAGTAPVGSFPDGDGRWGLVDIAGNVQEWLSTPFCPYDNPRCESQERSARGPAFLGNQVFKMRAARRNRDVIWHRSGDLGVRCARTP